MGHYVNSDLSRKKEPWHLDKRVPVGLMMVVLVQISGSIWGAARIVDRVEDQERRLSIVEKFDYEADHEMRDVGERLARLEEKTTMELDALNRIELMMRSKR